MAKFFGPPSNTGDENSSGQRVESASMTDFDAGVLALEAPSFLLLAGGFVVSSLTLASEPGRKEVRGVELGLHVAQDLGRGYAGWFVDGYEETDGEVSCCG